MADLLAHAAVNGILAGRRLDRTELFWFVSGALLPDLLCRGPEVFIDMLELLELVETPAATQWAGAVSLAHTPLGYLAFTVLIVLLLPVQWVRPLARPRLGWLLAGGGAIHMMIDFSQHHLVPGYMLLYPFSTRAWELGWISTEASLPALVVLVPLCAWIVWGRGGALRSPAPETPPGAARSDSPVGSSR